MSEKTIHYEAKCRVCGNTFGDHKYYGDFCPLPLGYQKYHPTNTFNNKVASKDESHREVSEEESLEVLKDHARLTVKLLSVSKRLKMREQRLLESAKKALGE